MKRSEKSLGWLALFAGATVVAAAVGARSTGRRPGLWYRTLAKPAGQPPAWVFGPVWTILYGLMAVSATRIADAARSPDRDRALRLWWLQLALNGAWSPLFFGAHRPAAAMADMLALSGAAAGYTRVSARVDRPAAWLMAPYLGWLGYAAWLNVGILRRNPRRA